MWCKKARTLTTMICQHILDEEEHYVHCCCSFLIQRVMKTISWCTELEMSGRWEPVAAAKLKLSAMTARVETRSPHCGSVNLSNMTG